MRGSGRGGRLRVVAADGIDPGRSSQRGTDDGGAMYWRWGVECRRGTRCEGGSRRWGTATASNAAARFYVIVNNVAKKANVGTMVRSAAAFGAKAMLIVGRKKSTTFFGSFGSNKHLKIMYFDKPVDGAFARAKGCVVWGIEMDRDAVSVVSRPLRGSAASHGKRRPWAE